MPLVAMWRRQAAVAGGVAGAAQVAAHGGDQHRDERDRPRRQRHPALGGADRGHDRQLGRLAEVDTPYIDAVLALTQQMGRSLGVYPTFPDEVLAEAAEGAID